MYNNEDWKQFYRLNKDGIGGAGGTAQGVDGLGYGYTPGINQYGSKGDWYAIAIINNGQGTNGYATNNGNHGTPSDTNPNYNEPLEDFHWISNYGGPYTGWGSTWVIGVTPLIHTDSTHLNQRSFAITYEDGHYQVDQIEAYYNHGATPPAFGWMYQGSPAGFGHIAIVFSWGESSASSQSVSHPNGATPGHALKYNGMYPAEGSLSLSDGRGSDSGTIYQAYNGTPSVNDPTMLIYGGYKYSYYFYDMREYGSISADSSNGDRGVYDSTLGCEL